LVGFGFALPPFEFGQGLLVSKLRLDLSLPFGDAPSFAGERGVVSAPNLTGRLDFGRLNIGAQVSARLRRSVAIQRFRYGSQLVSTIGVSFELLPEVLVLGSEWMAAPGIGAQAGSTRWVPAEWSTSLTLLWSSRYALALSGGTALPLSSQKLDVGNDRVNEEQFAALGSPKVRFVLMLRVESGE
jgi:hypothetical protein